ncbi:MAG: molybdopterin-dependent oxidoreductase [Candidatus Methanoperedens sp.]|nr:molybdopterin-dependent oxidoreductase [Candidatus Methanoperedens sp.]MCZ7370054.1 molybdopterin-dependent oxidoreductase [Candidatus Methanoperedens sp.]
MEEVPSFDPVIWKLTIDGLVSKPLTISYDELRSLKVKNRLLNFIAPAIIWNAGH